MYNPSYPGGRKYWTQRTRKKFPWRVWSGKEGGTDSPVPSVSGAFTAEDWLGRHGPSSGGPRLLRPLTDGAPHSASSSYNSFHRQISGRSSERESPLSHATSVNGSLDDLQERCAATAYKVSFHDNNRVKEHATAVVIHSRSFVLVDRYVTGHTQDIYSKSKKIWEHVPLGQVRVFSQLGSASPTMVANNSFPSSPVQPVSVSSARSEGRSNSCGSIGGSPHYTCIGGLDGLRKFGHWCGGMATIMTGTKETPVSAMAVELVDGEAGQVSAVADGGERYWLIGCTQKHVLVRLLVPEEDIRAYEEVMEATAPASTTSSTATMGAGPSPATTLALRMAYLWQHLLNHRPLAAVEELHDTMVRNEWTANFSAILAGWEGLVDYAGCFASPPLSAQGTQVMMDADGEPVGDGVGVTAFSPYSVDGTAPYDEVPPDSFAGYEPDEMEAHGHDGLIFYALTRNQPAEMGLCVPVEVAMLFFETHQLPTPHCQPRVVLGTPENFELRECINRQLNCAGYVFYGTATSGSEVITRLWKCESYAYVMERAVQETVVTHRFYGATAQQKIMKKLSGLSREVRPRTMEWERERLNFLVSFSHWLHRTQQLSPSTDAVTLRRIRGFWISLQRDFESTAAGLAEEDGGGESSSSSSDSSSGDSLSFPEIVILMGPQGCGKSTLARALCTLLEQAGLFPRWINQDEFGSARGQYLSAVSACASRRGEYTHLILDRMHLDGSSRNDYAKLPTRAILSVAWHDDRGPERLAETCLERVRQRGENHRSFKVAISPATSPTTTTAAADAAMDARSTNPNSAGRETAGSLNFNKVRAVVQQSVERYDLPRCHDDTLLLIDISLNLSTIIARTWERLQYCSGFPLPDLSELDPTQAERVAFQYEKIMRTYHHVIAEARLMVVNLTEVSAHVPAELQEGKNVVAEPYIVAHNFVVDPSPAAFVHYVSRLGSTILVRLKTIISDSRVTLIHVELESSLPLRAPPSRANPTNETSASPALTPTTTSSGRKDRVITTCSSFMTLYKAKKTSQKYCGALYERVMGLEQPDPYCVVVPLPATASAMFEFKLV